MLSAERTPSLGDVQMEPSHDPKVITSTALEALEDPELPLALKHQEQMRLLRQRMFVGVTVGGFIFMLIVATPVLVVTLSDPSARSGVERAQAARVPKIPELQLSTKELRSPSSRHTGEVKSFNEVL